MITLFYVSYLMKSEDCLNVLIHTEIEGFKVFFQKGSRTSCYNALEYVSALLIVLIVNEKIKVGQACVMLS